MLVSKTHYGCVGEFETSLFHQLEKLKTKIKKALYDKYSTVTIYEHGRAGACMTQDSDCHHLHLHFIPCRVMIANIINAKFNAYTLEKYSNSKTYFASFGDYLYVEEKNNAMQFYPTSGKKIPQHYLRTLIAHQIGFPERSNWENYTTEILVTDAKKNLPQSF